MKTSENMSKGRRTVIRTSALGLVGLSLSPLASAGEKTQSQHFGTTTEIVPKHFPNIDPEIVSEVVGKSHSNLERVKELVDKRPELARSVWEWRFGDFESAIGAASHVGRRDIVQYLIQKGARPTIFTFAMMGVHDVVKSMVEFYPGIQRTMGPHGISLLDHAYYGERMNDKMTYTEMDNLKKTIDYLESLGDAGGETYMDETKQEQKKFLGDYKYGEGEKDGFTISLNMRDKMTLGPIGGFGGALLKTKDNLYIYNGSPSVTVTFTAQDNTVTSLTLRTPDTTVNATKI
ncbi:hypothetical protein [Muricauda sp. MAR_2010_75]|uniref:hypothetical protein n=1 Tax=Allomuricauda sp. MAR_2010_75 TaxID=1250232 RepID=UPI00068BFC01|nr:hypothetical protein [Muricauda sp. MAR_2010_75]